MPYVPGQSGNPSGRPKGAAGLARYIADQTRDGYELVDRLLALSRDPRAPVREAQAATLALLDRLAGKPMQPSEIAMAISGGDTLAPAGWDAMEPQERVDWIRRERSKATS